jgi:hypothetical protein
MRFGASRLQLEIVSGVMSKTGWRDLVQRYQAATRLFHDRDQIASRIRQLKAQWQFCNRLCYDSGLGRRQDGSIDADDDWWETNTKVHSSKMLFPNLPT